MSDVSRRGWLKLGAAAGAGLLATARTVSALEATGRPPAAPPAADELQDLLQELVAKHRVPGAIAGVSHRGAVLTARRTPSACRARPRCPGRPGGFSSIRMRRAGSGSCTRAGGCPGGSPDDPPT